MSAKERQRGRRQTEDRLPLLHYGFLLLGSQSIVILE